MTVLFYRYGNICESDILNIFRSFNIDVIEETAEITDKTISPAKCVELVSHSIELHHPVFVFSINFFPAIAEVCHIYKILYLCWSVDSPVLELFSKAIQYQTNRIFLFDKAQYEYFYPYNENCIYHLPLATATERFDKILETLSVEDTAKYSSDISFVGSLYTEKNPFYALPSLPEYVSGYIQGIVDASLKVYGYNFTEEVLTQEIIDCIKTADPKFYSPANTITDPSCYVAAHSYIGMRIAEAERIRTLNTLAEHFDVHLYTRSDSSSLHGVHVHGGIKTHTEMPKVFHLSKINLNITIKPIQTGLPLRIFDIMGCGGFLMTNYQPELTEHFEIGTDLETYSSMDELIDKCNYYLTHEETRKQIAQTGYLKVQKCHNYTKRLMDMIRIATS